MRREGELKLPQVAQRNGRIHSPQKLALDKGLCDIIFNLVVMNRGGPGRLKAIPALTVLVIAIVLLELCYPTREVLSLDAKKYEYPSLNYWCSGSLAFLLCYCAFSLSYRFLYIRYIKLDLLWKIMTASISLDEKI